MLVIIIARVQRDIPSTQLDFINRVPAAAPQKLLSLPPGSGPSRQVMHSPLQLPLAQASDGES
jgi:hypothetical protein